MATRPVPSLPFLGRNIVLADKQSGVWPIAALFMCAMLQLSLVLTRAINWDEFWHYTMLQQLQDGTLAKPLQTFYLRLLGWIELVPGSVIDQIIAARSALLVCELIAAVAVAGIAIRFTDKVTGLLCALAYLSAGYVLQHGFSYRTDPIAAALLASALYALLVLRLRTPAVLLIGALMGLAAMITIKSVLYAPAFLGIAWLRWSEAGRAPAVLLRLAACALAGGGTFALVFAAYSLSMPVGSSEGARDTVSTSVEWMFLLGDLPFLGYVKGAALLAPLQAALIAATPFLLPRSELKFAEKVAIGGLLAPLLTLCVYTNTAPYYYVFMLPPVIAASAIAIKRARRYVSVSILSLLLALNALFVWMQENPRPLVVQRQLLGVAERTFREPVAYFDYSGFLGRFPKANGLVSSWGVKMYHEGTVPTLRETMEQRPVPLIMENHPSFTALLRGAGPVPEFNDADVAAIRSTYQHFWGPYWLAGTTIPRGTAPFSFELLVPGEYTLHGGAVTLDGRSRWPGDVIKLERGAHRAAGNRAATVQLRWGNRIETPTEAEPTGPMWVGF